MRERVLVAAAVEHASAWLRDEGARHVAARRECRTIDGTGRADALIAALDADGIARVVVIEAKSAAMLHGVVPLPSPTAPQHEVGALRQLRRYPGNAHVLACHDGALDAAPLVRDLLHGVCAREGVGLLVVDWYGEARWRLLPRWQPTPWLWADCLDGYAAGAALRGALGPEPTTTSRGAPRRRRR